MLEKLDNAIFSNDDIVVDNEDTDNVTFFNDEMGLNTIYLNNIILDDDNFDDYDHEPIIHVRSIAWCNNYKQRKACKKEISKELVHVVWHPTRWRDWYMSEDEKKKK